MNDTMHTATALDQENRASLGVPSTYKGFLLSPLTPGDFGRLREYVRELAIADVRNPMLALADVFDQLPPKLQAVMSREACAQAAGAKKPEPTQEAIREKLMSLDGVRQWFWLSARKAKPSLTREEVTGLIGEDDRHELIDLFATLEQAGVAGGEPGDNSDPKAS